MKDSFYFPHDFNAIQDPKMMMLLSECGAEGVGIYWIMIEILHQQGGSISLDAFNTYLKFYGMPKQGQNDQNIDKLSNILFKLNLLEKDNEKVFSKRVQENLKIRKSIRKKRSDAGKESAKKRALTALNKRSTNVEQVLNKYPTKSNKGKERKGKERKGKEIKEDNIPASFDAVQTQEVQISNTAKKPRPKSNDPAHKIIEAFAEEYQKRSGRKYVIKWAQFTVQVKRLLKGLQTEGSSEDEILSYIKTLIPIYFNSTEEKWWDVSAFTSNFNKLQASAGRNKNGNSDLHEWLERNS